MSEPLSRVSSSARAFIALCAVTALTAAATTAASATGTFGVSTTVTASCSVTTSPITLTPSYSASTGVSIGAPSTLVTTCNGAAPTVAFTDATGAGTVFKMIGTTSPANILNFQISNTLSCTGIVADVAIPQATVEPLITGASQSYDICVAVIANQLLAASDHYTDTVTYTINAGT